MPPQRTFWKANSFLFCVYNCSQNQRCLPHLRMTKHRGLWQQLGGQESIHMLWVLVITVWLSVASWLWTSLSWKTHYGTDPQNEQNFYCNYGICLKLKAYYLAVITAATEIEDVRRLENEFTTCFVNEYSQFSDAAFILSSTTSFIFNTFLVRPGLHCYLNQLIQ